MLSLLFAAILLADSPPPGPQNAPAVVGANNILADGAIPNDGKDDSAAIQKTLNRGGIVLVPSGQWDIQTQLVATAGTAIELSVTAKIVAMPGLNGPLLRNKNWISSYNGGGTPINDGSNIVDRSITVRGGTWDHNRRNGSATSGGGRLNPAGQYLPAIGFYGVQDVLITDTHVYDPCTYGVHLANAFDAVCRNIEVISPALLQGIETGNTDGIHLNGPCSRITVDGLRGATGDDFFAICADDGNVANNPDVNNNPAIYGGYATVYCGPITQVSARNLKMRGSPGFGSLSALRILSSTNRIDQIDVSDVAGQVQYHAFIGALFPLLSGNGNVGRVTLRDWKVGVMGNNGPGDCYAIVTGNYESLDLLNHQTDEGYTRGVKIGGTVQRLKIERHIQENNSGLVLDPVVSFEGANVGLAEISGSWRRLYVGSTPTPTPWVSLDSNSAVGYLTLSGHVELTASVLRTAGPISYLNVNNTRHLFKANGTASIAATATVSSLTGAGNIGLTTSGTFTTTTGFQSQ